MGKGELNQCSLEVGTRCMLKCRMCYLWKNSNKDESEKPTLEQWKSFIDSLMICMN